MILYVIAEYRNATEIYKPGDVIEVSPDRAAWLQKDSPGSFSTEKPEPPKEVKAIDAPPKDKAVKRSTTRRKTTKK